MDRQKLEEANKLINEIDKFVKVKNFIGAIPSPNVPRDNKIENIRLKNNSGYLDFKIDEELSNIILLIIDSFIKERIQELNKEFREL